MRIVQHGRHHPLLQKGLKENPEQVLPYLTVKARPFIDQTTILLAPYFRQLLTDEQLASINVKAAAVGRFVSRDATDSRHRDRRRPPRVFDGASHRGAQ
ncbi:TetR family transcriptional regulator [Mycobacteroides abscessus subsp. abscessus]|nr:TetR family transcriptional regulator [Mycobacteroides abscessus subsp. abscessus]